MKILGILFMTLNAHPPNNKFEEKNLGSWASFFNKFSHTNGYHNGSDVLKMELIM